MNKQLDLKERASYQDIYYLKGAKRLDNNEFANKCQEKDSFECYALMRINEQTGEENYFVKLREGNTIDPYNTDVNFKRSDRFTYKRVSAEGFESYIKFLQNGALNLYNNFKRSIGA